MNKNITLFISFFLISLFSNAQVRGAFGHDGFLLDGEMEIHFKNGEVIKGEFQVEDKKIKNSEIDYQEINYIEKDYERYEYVCIGKNEVRLLKLYSIMNFISHRRVVFYEGVGKWIPKANAKMGHYASSTKSNHFIGIIA